MKCWTAAICLATLGGCSATAPNGEPAFEDHPKHLAYSSTGAQIYTAVAARDSTPSTLQSAAAERCKTQTSCIVNVWANDENVPVRMPMLKRESDGIVFRYSSNRRDNSENAVWDCTVWEGTEESCLIR